MGHLVSPVQFTPIIKAAASQSGYRGPSSTPPTPNQPPPVGSERERTCPYPVHQHTDYTSHFNLPPTMSAFAPFAANRSSFTRQSYQPQSTSPLKSTYIPGTPSSSSSSTRTAVPGTCDSSDSSDEDDDVFFGAPGEKEVELVAKLSHALPATPLPRRRSVRKRDSREFMRRQTILVSPKQRNQKGKAREEKGTPSRGKVWPGGFYERRDSVDVQDDSDSSSSSSPPPTLLSPTSVRASDCDLTFDFSRFCVSSPSHVQRAQLAPSVLEDDRHSTDESWTEEELGGSDKENYPALQEDGEDGEDEGDEVEGEAETYDEGPLIGAALIDEIVKHDLDAALDIGALRLSDFDDQDEADDDQLDDGCLTDSTDDEGVEGSLPEADTSLGSPIRKTTTPLLRSPLGDLPSPSSPPTPASSIDRPLPDHRAGPVIIPSLPQNSSPMSSPPPLTTNLPQLEITAAMLLGRTPESSPLSSAPSLDAISTPTRNSRHTLSAKQGKRVLKSTLASAIVPATIEKVRLAASTRTLAPDEATKRSLAIANQLNMARKGKLGMGPPQRSVSAASSSSSSSSASLQNRPISRLGVDKAKTKEGGIPRHAQPFKRTEKATTAVPNAAARPVAGRIPVRPPPTSSRAGTTLKPTKPAPTAAPRTALGPRTLPQPQPQPSGLSQSTINPHFYRPYANKPSALAASSRTNLAPRPSPVRPLKRPLPVAQPSAPRAAITASGPRPMMGPPARVVGDQVFTLASSRPIPPKSPPPSGSGFADLFNSSSFSMGLAASPCVQRTGRSPRGLGSASRPVPGSVRSMKQMGTPSKMRGVPGTPSRLVASPRPLRLAPVLEALAGATSPTKQAVASRDVGVVEQSTSSGPPATATRSADPNEEDVAQRGSSLEYEEVSFALQPASSEAGSSPSLPPASTLAKTKSPSPEDRRKAQEAQDAALSTDAPLTRSRSNSDIDRPKRTSRPPKPPTVLSRPAARAGESIVSNMSEKELKAKTAMNTTKNEKRVAAIERQVVNFDIERPPSPTSKIPTTAARLEAERKRSREHRAKRRQVGEEGTPEPEVPIVTRVERSIGPGEEEEWVDVERPAKRARLDGEGEGKAEGEGKRVKWDKGVIVIRDFGDALGKSISPSASASDAGLKSSLRADKQIQLDQYGNVPTTSAKLVVKPQRVVVKAIFYRGEEAYVAPAQGTRGKKKV